jgi:hypothetical protein
MQVISGPIGREKVHYEAPAADRMAGEMRAFLDWFNGETINDPYPSGEGRLVAR